MWTVLQLLMLLLDIDCLSPLSLIVRNVCEQSENLTSLLRTSMKENQYSLQISYKIY